MNRLNRLAAVFLLAAAALPAGAQISEVPPFDAPLGADPAAAGAGAGAASAAAGSNASAGAPAAMSATPAPTLSPGIQERTAAAVANVIPPISKTPSISLPARSGDRAAPRSASPAAPAAKREGAQAVAPREQLNAAGRRSEGMAEVYAPAAKELGDSIFDQSGEAGPSNDGSGAVESPPGGGAGAGGWNFDDGGSFEGALERRGVPRPFIMKVFAFLAARHPGDQDKIYHSLHHTMRAANAVAAVIDGPGGRELTPRQGTLLLFSALLHDLDPERPADSPASVARTFEYLDKNPAALALLSELEQGGWASRKELKALIKFTDFDLRPEKMARITADARAMADAAFQGRTRDWAYLWGPRLAFTDQASMYLGAATGAERAVRGLAHELRTAGRLAAETEGRPAPAGPSDEAVLAGTAGFLKPLLESPNFPLLPARLQDNLRETYRFFQRKVGPPARTPDSAPIREARRASRREWFIDGLPAEYVGGGGFKNVVAPQGRPGVVVKLFTQAGAQEQGGSAREMRREAARSQTLEAIGRAPKTLFVGQVALDAPENREIVAYAIQERVSGADLRKMDAEKLQAARELFDDLIQARIKLQDAVLMRENIIVGRTPSDGRPRAYVLDAGEAAVLKTPGLLERIQGKADPRIELRDYYDGFLRRWAREEAHLELALSKERIDAMVKDYPDNAQGRAMRVLAEAVKAKSGGSIEELTRSGAFLYANFIGLAVRGGPTAGRYPDMGQVDVIFYAEIHDGKWKIGVYNQNHRRDSRRRPDADYERALKRWLLAGGIPKDAIIDPPAVPSE